MQPLHVIALALVQAATEFLPISSSAHLVLARWLLGWNDAGLAFDVALHVGTLLALATYFAPTWIRILGLAAGRRLLEPGASDADSDLFSRPGMLWLLVAATVPAAAAGLLMQDLVEERLRGPALIGAMLVGVGALIWWADRHGSLRADLGAMTLRLAMLVGCAQAVALIPGTSRSGITIAAGLAGGLTRPAAARFSFLLSMPIVFGAGLKTALTLTPKEVAASGGIGHLALGICVSAVAGLAVIHLFLRHLQRSTLAPFVYYRLVIGCIVLGLAGGPCAAAARARLGQSA